MSIVSSETILDSINPNGFRVLNYKFTDHLGEIYYAGQFTLTPELNSVFDINADIELRKTSLESRIATREVEEAVSNAYDTNASVERIAQHQNQADFDRRALGRLMLIDDLFVFNRSLPFFRAVEIRAGNPPNSRYQYLNITPADYELIEYRYNQHAGISSFIEAEKLRIWDELPEGYE